ncbi:MAG: antitoxin [Promethearchaeota archaeon]|nr:MAG: antitoxin [Candidatus Lokiarchaeota archaeon]
MTHKTISLSEKAYNLLKKVKREGESFSKVIERLISKKENPWLKMQNKFDPKFFDDLNENIRRLREKNLTGSEEDD